MKVSERVGKWDDRVGGYACSLLQCSKTTAVHQLLADCILHTSTATSTVYCNSQRVLMYKTTQTVYYHIVQC